MKYRIFILKVLRPISVISVLFFCIFMLVFPSVCKNGAISGILLCGNVIIPSLFPFTFCTLYIMNIGITERLYGLEKFARAIFGLNCRELSVFLLSMIGGYPTGARLIGGLYKNGEISDRKAGLMLCFCVNAGPGFLVMAVGEALLHSKALGYILLAAHIIPPVIIALIFRPFLKNGGSKAPTAAVRIPAADNIVQSAADAATAVFGICSYVILFSVVGAVSQYLTEYLPLLSYITPLLEVTSAVAGTKNIYFIAFLTGFAGICIWCQALGMVKGIKINLPLFALSRLFHGLLSYAAVYLLLKIFKITVPTISNGIAFSGALNYSGAALTLSLVGMGILFIISTFKSK